MYILCIGFYGSTDNFIKKYKNKNTNKRKRKTHNVCVCVCVKKLHIRWNGTVSFKLPTHWKHVCPTIFLWLITRDSNLIRSNMNSYVNLTIFFFFIYLLLFYSILIYFCYFILFYLPIMYIMVIHSMHKVINILYIISYILNW